MFIGLSSVCTIGSFSESLACNYEGRLKCVSLNNWICEARPTLVDINSNEILFYLFMVSVNKCGGSCNNLFLICSTMCCE